MPSCPPPQAADACADRRLIGIYPCGALASQFEPIYGWMNTNNFSNVFSPGFDTQDAVIASRAVPGAGGSFVMPTTKGKIQVSLPQFITTRGTAYFLLPSIASLQAIAAKTV